MKEEIIELFEKNFTIDSFLTMYNGMILGDNKNIVFENKDDMWICIISVSDKKNPYITNISKSFMIHISLQINKHKYAMSVVEEQPREWQDNNSSLFDIEDSAYSSIIGNEFLMGKHYVLKEDKFLKLKNLLKKFLIENII